MKKDVFWQRTPTVAAPRLNEALSADFAIVGGGIAGLSVAQALLDEAPGCRVVLVESRFCGAGASGRSSGFVTPDSELQVVQLVRRFGVRTARELWLAAAGATELIRSNIATISRDCGLLNADSLYVAKDDRSWDVVAQEHKARTSLGFPSRLYSRSELPQVLGKPSFGGGVRYPGTFAIDSFAYVQGLRDALVARGLRVFENSPVVAVNPYRIDCEAGTVTARAIFFCTDRFTPDLGLRRTDAYHAQTALALTGKISPDLMKDLFPESPLMVWDTDLTYGYFRPTPDGRLLIGGGLLQNTYSANVDESPRVIDHLRQYVDANLPALRGTKFTNWWPGFIGVTKDLLPVAGQSPDTPSHYFAICGAGLPWATLAGRVAAGVALGYNPPLADQFRPGRSFTDLDPLQNILGKPVTFALSHYYAKEYLRGGPRAVRRRKALVAGLIAAAAGALSWAFCCAALHGARRWRSDQRA